MKILLEVRHDLLLELALCDSSRDVAKVLSAAEIELKQSTATWDQKQSMWLDTKRLLISLFRDTAMSVKGQSLIDDIIKRSE